MAKFERNRTWEFVLNFSGNEAKFDQLDHSVVFAIEHSIIKNAMSLNQQLRKLLNIGKVYSHEESFLRTFRSEDDND